MKKFIFSLLALSLLIVACNSEKKEDATDKKMEGSAMESKQERNKKVIMASMESFNKGDWDAVFKDIAPGFTDYTDGSLPPITNLDSLKGLIKMLTTSIQGYKGNNLKFYADGDYVIVHGDWSGTFKTDLMGIKATGKPVQFKDVDIFRLNDDGKVLEHSSVQNLGAVLIASSMMK